MSGGPVFFEFGLDFFESHEQNVSSFGKYGITGRAPCLEGLSKRLAVFLSKGYPAYFQFFADLTTQLFFSGHARASTNVLPTLSL